MTFTEADCLRSRGDFPALERTVDDRPIAYLDGPAGTQVPRAVIDAITCYYEKCNANSHGEFVTSRESDLLVHETREAAAAFLGAPSWREVSFGQNMTTLAFSLSRALVREWQPGDEVVITQLDHEANRGPWLSLEERGIVVREVAVQPDGRLDYSDLERKVTSRTRLVALGLASNALGTVNDVAYARRLASSVGAYLLLDAVHYAAHFPVDVTALDTDFLLCSAYKFYGPHVGLLYCRPGLLDRLRTDKLRVQEDEAPFKIETGTLNHAALAGVKAAIEYIASWGPEGRSARGSSPPWKGSAPMSTGSRPTTTTPSRRSPASPSTAPTSPAPGRPRSRSRSTASRPTKPPASWEPRASRSGTATSTPCGPSRCWASPSGAE